MANAKYEVSDTLKKEIIECADFKQLSRIAKKLNKEFNWKSKKDELMEINNQSIPDKLDHLPGTEIEIDNIKYIIHGIFHEPYLPFFRKKLKNHEIFVRENALGFHKLNEGMDYILEERFARIYKLKKENEMDDVSFIFNKYGYEEFSKILYSLFWEAFWRIRNHYNSKGLTSEIMYNYDPLESVECWLPLRKIRESLCRAPPLQDDAYFLEKEYILTHQRSKYMASYIKNFGRDRQLTSVHAIVGLLHEHSIRTFLNYENYEFPLLLLNIYPD